MTKLNGLRINPVTVEPYQDQWKFLQEIQKVPLSILEKLSVHFIKPTVVMKESGNLTVPETGKIKIELTEAIIITRAGLT